MKLDVWELVKIITKPSHVSSLLWKEMKLDVWITFFTSPPALWMVFPALKRDEIRCLTINHPLLISILLFPALKRDEIRCLNNMLFENSSIPCLSFPALKRDEIRCLDV